MSVQSEVGVASHTLPVLGGDAENSAMSDLPKNCSDSAESLERGDSESVPGQPVVLPSLKEEIQPGSGEIQHTVIMEKSGIECGDSTDAVCAQVVHSSAVTSPWSIDSDMLEQLAVLQNTVRSLTMSNDELRAVISDGMAKVEELESAYADSVARNKQLEQQLAQLTSSTEHVVSDLALLSTRVTQVSALVDKPTEVKPTALVSVEGDAATTSATDMSSLLPTIEQRVAVLELKLQQSESRFGEFASALDSIERDLQRYIRRHSLVVENLSPKEDRSASDAFLIFVNSVLGVAVDDSDIDGYHLLDRIPAEDGATVTDTQSPDKKKDLLRPRPLLITFTCYRTRTQVYKAWLCYRVGTAGSGKAAAGLLSGERGLGVCIREYLTPSQEAVYRKADETRHRRSDVIKDCWTFRGRTFVRTNLDEVHEFNETSDQFASTETKTRSCAVM